MTRTELTLEKLLNGLIDRIPSILLAIAILLIGIWLIKYLIRFLTNRFTKSNVDVSLSNFLISVFKVILYVLLILNVISTLGIPTTSFVAVLGAAGLAVGLALQGSLSNFAGGVLILLFKPFRVGHTITAANGVNGTVLKIDILYTTLRAVNGTTLYAPNGPLANAVINNFSDSDTRMLEYIIGVSYESNIDTARKVIVEILEKDSRILHDPKPAVLVSSLGDNAVNLTIRAWVANHDYAGAYFHNYQVIKEELDNNKIGIPFPQRELRIIHTSTPTEGEK
ncbi:mechanosensitive ion channel family protein [Pedobacter nutrimenti]|jgi:small conductance mechanosensitive channel|uniref:Small conductance mechanosensitive channel n=1 Tax=Pedobacter nutrimenti TaxID=1241337 RepID=A0A318UIU5_9SPHI|nr:mechanosensitive ion channel domain-containing protein [Pedobacter nutrimenti]PYF73855.1 small conductance mechanosensitive channel [Pedobacter nutrimenti]|eukprot:gene16396-19508_t